VSKKTGLADELDRLLEHRKTRTEFDDKRWKDMYVRE